MSILVAFFAAAAVAMPAALFLARRGSVDLGRTPWSVHDMARQHVIIMGSLGGFSMTGLVLLVAFTRGKSGATTTPLDAAVILLIVSIIFYVSNAFLLSYMPTQETSGEIIPRLHLSLCSTIEYRTIFLTLSALVPLLHAHGFSQPATILAQLLLVLLLFNTIVVAMVADGVGLMRFWETYAVTAIAIALGILFVSSAHNWPHHYARTEHSTMAVCIVQFCVNGLSFAVVGTTPLAARHPVVRRFFDGNARRLTIADMQLTMIAQAFLWLSVSGVV
jgi:hypothetical protein